MNLFFTFSSDRDEIEKLLTMGIQFSGVLVDSFLMRPSQKVLIVYPGNQRQSHYLVKAKWGITPSFAPSLNLITIDKNKLEKSENFAPYLMGKRALLICDSVFIETKRGNQKQYVHPEGKNLFVPGFYELADKDGAVMFCPLVTDQERDKNTPRHERTMPFILTDEEKINTWLDRDSTRKDIVSLLYSDSSKEIQESLSDVNFDMTSKSLVNPKTQQEYSVFL